MKKLICWWRGHATKNMAAYYCGERDCCIWLCSCCGKELDFNDLSEYSAQHRFMRFVEHWFFRKWFPRKCCECGRRYKCDDSINHIPF